MTATPPVRALTIGSRVMFLSMLRTSGRVRSSVQVCDLTGIRRVRKGRHVLDVLPSRGSRCLRSLSRWSMMRWPMMRWPMS